MFDDLSLTITFQCSNSKGIKYNGHVSNRCSDWTLLTQELENAKMYQQLLIRR